MIPRMIVFALVVSFAGAFAPIQEASCVASATCPNHELALDDTSVKSAMITVEAFFDGEACKVYRETPLLSSHVQGNGVGELIVESNHVQKMASTFNAIGSTIKMDQETEVVARHTYLEHSTLPHQDFFAEGDMQGQLVTSSSAFVFLNSNPDAMFLHGDADGIPIVEGTLVVFDGAVSHHTQVESGTVHLLGPLNTESMLRVGNSTGNSTDSDPDPTKDPIKVDCPKGGFLVAGVCIEFGIFELFLTVSGVIASVALCSVGVTGNES